jgi:hypothetical protein
MAETSSPVVRCRTLDNRWAFEIPDGGSVTVGRDPRYADVALPFDYLSRRHVQFRNEAGACLVEPLDNRGYITINSTALV